ncbi:hypothetical protein FACS189494_07900 [Spirochaetia bacterium]|nr:hypothetical protein FACS189494_07900 [Spirochaetia bacterium]
MHNPVNPKQVSHIVLDPKQIECIVFWTKNPKPFMKYLDEVDSRGFRYYFQFTITPYGKDIECNVDKSDVIETFMRLSDRIGKEKVIWRCDPIFLNSKYTTGYHEEKFGTLCKKLSSYTEKCVISFIDSYNFLKNTFLQNDITELSDDDIVTIIEKICVIAAEYKLPLVTCAEKIDLAKYGIAHNCCIDAELISRLSGSVLPYKKDKNQRPECGCAQSRDIGTYSTCRHGCVYCYAKRYAGVKAAGAIQTVL